MFLRQERKIWHNKQSKARNETINFKLDIPWKDEKYNKIYMYKDIYYT